MLDNVLSIGTKVLFECSTHGERHVGHISGYWRGIGVYNGKRPMDVPFPYCVTVAGRDRPIVCARDELTVVEESAVA
jgi:hypothetical protein